MKAKQTADVLISYLLATFATPSLADTSTILRGQNKNAVLTFTCISKTDLVAALWFDLSDFKPHGGVITYTLDNTNPHHQRGFATPQNKKLIPHHVHFLIEPDHNRATKKVSLQFMQNLWGKNNLSFTYGYKKQTVQDTFDLTLLHDGRLETVTTDCARTTVITTK